MADYTVSLQSGRTISINADTPRQAEEEAKKRNPNDSVVSVSPAAVGGLGYDPFGGVFGTPAPQFISPAATTPDLPFYLQPGGGDIGTARDTSGVSSMFATPQEVDPAILALRDTLGRGAYGFTDYPMGDGGEVIDPPAITKGGGGAGAPEINIVPDVGDPLVPLEERDPYSTFIKSMGLGERPVTDPYRRYLQGRYQWDYENPYMFQQAFKPDTGIGMFAADANLEDEFEGFEDYLKTVRTPMQGREIARQAFNRAISPAAPDWITSFLGPGAEKISLELLDQPQQEFLSRLGSLGRSAVQGQMGTPGFNLIQNLLPSAPELYQDYFSKAQAGKYVAPSFGKYLQSAYGLT